MTEDSTSTVRALAWSSKMRGTTGRSKVGGGLGATGERGVGAVKARAPAVTSLHRFTVRRHLATLRHGGWPPLCHPFAAVRRGHPPRGRGRHFEKWFRKSSWPALAFFSGLDPAARSARHPSLFRAWSFAWHSKSKGRKSGRATKRGKTIAAKDAEINERVAGVCVFWLLSPKWWDFRYAEHQP